MPANQRRSFGGKQPLCQVFEGRVRRAIAGVNPVGLAKFKLGLGIENVPRKRHEYRAGWGGQGNLGGTAYGSRQVRETGDLNGPLHERPRDGFERRVQHRFGQTGEQ